MMDVCANMHACLLVCGERHARVSVRDCFSFFPFIPLRLSRALCRRADSVSSVAVGR